VALAVDARLDTFRAGSERVIVGVQRTHETNERRAQRRAVPEPSHRILPVAWNLALEIVGSVRRLLY
jgi:hypothetical protein